jgi:hypothetical protein
MENNLRYWEPRKGRLYDTDSNLNYVDLNEPYEVWAQPVFPSIRPPVKDPLHYFRKVLLWTTYSDLLKNFRVDENGNVKLGRDKREDTTESFSKKFRYLLDTFASKKKVKSIMKQLTVDLQSRQVTSTEFYYAVYREIKHNIKRKLNQTA